LLHKTEREGKGWKEGRVGTICRRMSFLCGILFISDYGELSRIDWGVNGERGRRTIFRKEEGEADLEGSQEAVG
jgi:hypothetical protein